ncbi:MAG: glycine--tRNA ligase subunit alpha [Armatimonadia bacterium]|nr:glycine--tRNA ligase subunit alpha [Armatimonadia bacterium]
MTFQETLMTLHSFWGDRGCVVEQPYDLEMGAGTMAPATFIRALGPEPYNVAYVQPSRRPADARYGENPYRLARYFQYQVILKPSPDNVQEIYIESLAALGFDPIEHDIRFVEDDWENPSLGAGGVGWEVWMDGMEITQFTYFQQVGGVEVDPVCAEITYGPERLVMYMQDVDHYKDIDWSAVIPYGAVRQVEEYQISAYGFEVADIDMLYRHFDDFEGEAARCIEAGLPLAAYELVLKCSHTFNLLDARGAVSVSERTALIGRVRKLASRVARTWLEQREEAGWPLLAALGKGGEA